MYTENLVLSSPANHFIVQCEELFMPASRKLEVS